MVGSNQHVCDITSNSTQQHLKLHRSTFPTQDSSERDKGGAERPPFRSSFHGDDEPSKVFGNSGPS